MSHVVTNKEPVMKEPPRHSVPKLLLRQFSHIIQRIQLLGRLLTTQNILPWKQLECGPIRKAIKVPRVTEYFEAVWLRPYRCR